MNWLKKLFKSPGILEWEPNKVYRVINSITGDEITELKLQRLKATSRRNRMIFKNKYPKLK